MRLKIMVVLLFVLAILFGCSSGDEGNEASNSTNIKNLVQDYTVGNIDAASASITSAELVVIDKEQTETVYDLPDDEFFVSIAPFIDETHT